MHKYLMMDCESAETPKIDGQLDVKNGQAYDLGLRVIDETGKVYEEVSLINEDVFFGMPESMQEAYYASKMPQYLEDMRMGKRKIVDTWRMYQIFHRLCKEHNIEGVIAHNAFFDINVLNATIRYQTKSRCRWFLPWGIEIIDTMKLARNTFAKDPKYVSWCVENGFMTNHKVPRPRLTAEILYRYITNDLQFEEKHTGLEDVQIETEIFLKCLERMGEQSPIFYMRPPARTFNTFVTILCLTCNTFFDIIRA